MNRRNALKEKAIRVGAGGGGVNISGCQKHRGAAKTPCNSKGLRFSNAALPKLRLMDLLNVEVRTGRNHDTRTEMRLRGAFPLKGWDRGAPP